MEWREEPQSFNEHVQPFLSPVFPWSLGTDCLFRLGGGVFERGDIIFDEDWFRGINFENSNFNFQDKGLAFYVKVVKLQLAFSCQTSGLVYCISCRRYPAVYICESGRTLRQRFGEHLRSIEKNLPGFPVAEHFNTAGHSIDDALVRGMMLSVDNAQRKRVEMRMIFQLGTSQPRGLNSDFRFL